MTALVVMSPQDVEALVKSAVRSAMAECAGGLLTKSLTRKEVAERYQISLSTLRREIIAGTKPRPDQGERWSRVGLDKWDADRAL